MAKRTNYMNDVVTITCYRQTEKMTRKEAMSFYREAMMFSEGSEHERYEHIYFMLVDGFKHCYDC